MTAFFKTLLSLSISGSLLAGLVWLCRRWAGRHISRTAGYYLWLLVLLRLVLPFGLPNSLMAHTFAQLSSAAAQHWEAPDLPAATDRVAANDTALSPAAPSEPTDGPASVDSSMVRTALPQQAASGVPVSFAAVMFGLWAAGAAAVFLSSVGSYARLRTQLKRESCPPDPEDLAVFRQMFGQLDGPCRVRLVCSTAAKTPMLLGLLRPVLVLPARAYLRQGFEPQLRCLLQHEMTHYVRRDLWYKWFWLVVRAIHWFNPLMPLLGRAIAQDCELACDEAVTARMNAAQRRCYGNTLLAFAAGCSLPKAALATTLAGSEKEQLRQRLTDIRTPHRRTRGTIVLTACLAAVLVGCGTALGAASSATGDAPAAYAPSALPEKPSTGQLNAEPDDDALVMVRDYIPGLPIELKYATADNLTGQPLYDFTEPMLRYGTVKKLAAAQQALLQQGYSLKLWDAYRPLAAQEALWNACPDPAYVSNPATGYLGHTRGNTVDVTLVMADGTEIAMPSGFDQFDARADRDYSDVSAEAAHHAQILQESMEAAGFAGYPAEWNHYSDTTEYDQVTETRHAGTITG